jgi:hypothetical protein
MWTARRERSQGPGEFRVPTVIRDMVDGKEYRDRFGDSNIQQPSGEKQAAVACL